jgi:hypothetical protein
MRGIDERHVNRSGVWLSVMLSLVFAQSVEVQSGNGRNIGRECVEAGENQGGTPVEIRACNWFDILIAETVGVRTSVRGLLLI